MASAAALAAVWALALLRRRPGFAWTLGALALTVALLHGRSLRYGFVTDDFFFARPLDADAAREMLRAARDGRTLFQQPGAL